MYKQFLFNIFGQFLQVHFLICIHSQTLLSQILMKILQDIRYTCISEDLETGVLDF